MTYRGIQTLEVLEQAYNYNKWISSSIEKHLAPPVLEIGAGIGNIASLIRIAPIFLTDKDFKLVESLRRKFKSKKEIEFAILDVEKSYLKNRTNYFQSAYAVNVLEHIANDLAALKNINKMLQKGGQVVLLVPANNFAFTKLDRELGHFRRYSKKGLSEKLKKAGFRVKYIKPFNMLGLLSWMIRDKIGKEHSKLVASQVRTFDVVVPILKILETFVPIPNGISLIVVAQKV